jgi:coatomer subunit beta'
MFIRVYNYNTTERIKAFEAHQDYIRSLAIHPTLPYVLSASDDMTIKLWDWDKGSISTKLQSASFFFFFFFHVCIYFSGWDCLQTFEGHSHYVMQVEFNPKDPNTFVSASLDRSIKVWGLNSATPHFSLEGHDRGVNCISYFPGGEKPFLVSGADDSQLKVWDYQTKSCVATLEGHTNNVSSVAFHPHLPIIITGSEVSFFVLYIFGFRFLFSRSVL